MDEDINRQPMGLPKELIEDLFKIEEVDSSRNKAIDIIKLRMAKWANLHIGYVKYLFVFFLLVSAGLDARNITGIRIKGGIMSRESIVSYFFDKGRLVNIGIKYPTTASDPELTTLEKETIRLFEENKKLKERIEELEKALKKYDQHEEDCDYILGW